MHLLFDCRTSRKAKQQVAARITKTFALLTIAIAFPSFSRWMLPNKKPIENLVKLTSKHCTTFPLLLFTIANESNFNHLKKLHCITSVADMLLKSHGHVTLTMTLRVAINEFYTLMLRFTKVKIEGEQAPAQLLCMASELEFPPLVLKIKFIANLHYIL